MLSPVGLFAAGFSCSPSRAGCKKDREGLFHRKASFVRPWSIVAALLIVSLIIGSWVVVSQMARKQPSEAAGRAAVPNETPRDVYTAYKDVVYKLSGRDGSVIWKFALKQAYKPGSSTSFTHYFIYAIRLANGATNWKYDIGSLLDVQVPITELLLAP
jgi:outer membrane protein assembly factor BamB